MVITSVNIKTVFIVCNALALNIVNSHSNHHGHNMSISKPSELTNISNLNYTDLTIKATIKDDALLCKKFKLDLPYKRHVVKIDVLGNFAITKNIHHILLLMCAGKSANINVGPVFDCRRIEKYPDGFAECWHNLYVNIDLMTTMGTVWQLAPDLALPLGGVADHSVMKVLTHFHKLDRRLYDRPLEWTVRLWHSDPIRPKEIQIMSVGLVPHGGPLILPKRKRFINVGHCSNQCFNELATNGSTVAMAQPHFHDLGSDIIVRHFQRGRELPTLYEKHRIKSFHELMPQVLAREVWVGPDDQLTVECTYDSTRRNTTKTILHSMVEPGDEMCIIFFYAYPPAKKMPFCMSVFSPDTLKRISGFDECARKRTFQPNVSLEKFVRDKNDWSKDTQDFVRYEKQLMACSFFGYNATNWIGYPSDYVPARIRGKLIHMHDKKPT